MTYTSVYRKSWQLLMRIEMFGHNQSNGTLENHNSHKKLYTNTINYIISCFGPVNLNIWKPVEIRFNQAYEWLNHLSLMHRRKFFKKNKMNILKNIKSFFL